MNMTLSKRGDYVMRSALLLARAFDEGGTRKIREVVAGTKVPQTFASQILADLVRAGLATSRSGRDGGYRLSRPPGEITVLEVIEAAEGPLRADRCALGEGPCHWEAVCPLHETWSAATVLLRDLLARTSLAEVAARDAAIEAGTYALPADSHRLRPLAVAVADVVQVELPAAQAHLALARAARDLANLAAASFLAAGPAAGPPRTGAASRRDQPTVEASLAPTGPKAADEATGTVHYLLGCWASGGENAGHLEADLSVTAVDTDRCELRVEGTWRRDSGATALAQPELERWARRMLRAFLRNLAWDLERPAMQRVPTRLATKYHQDGGTGGPRATRQALGRLPGSPPDGAGRTARSTPPPGATGRGPDGGRAHRAAAGRRPTGSDGTGQGQEV
jgi:Rrf2 family iron-sulfur cluster assembly transcriptional regulator